MRHTEKSIYGFNRISELELPVLFGDILLYLLVNVRENGLLVT